MPKREEQILLGPLTCWVHRELDKLDREARFHPEWGLREYAPRKLAERLGISERLLGLWRDQLDSDGRPRFTVPRARVEDALDQAGVLLFDVYPWMAESDQVREGFCTACDERVFVDGDDRCVWCGGPTAKPM